MKNSKYWEERFLQLEKAQNKISTETLKQVIKCYDKTLLDIEYKITYWYERIVHNNDISFANARQFLSKSDLQEFKWELEDYIRYGKENSLNQKWIKELENASAKWHITKLESLKIQLQNSLETLQANQLKIVTEAVKEVYRSNYYHAAYEIQKGFEIGWDIACVDNTMLNKIISKPWAPDGRNFSSRIWENKNKLVNELHKTLTQSIMLGEDPQKVINHIAKTFGVSKRNAGALVMTEESFFASEARNNCFNDLEVEQYQIVATLDIKTSEICRETDGKVFYQKDYKSGETAPPFHVK